MPTTISTSTLIHYFFYVLDHTPCMRWSILFSVGVVLWPIEAMTIMSVNIGGGTRISPKRTTKYEMVNFTNGLENAIQCRAMWLMYSFIMWNQDKPKADYQIRNGEFYKW